MSVDEERRLRDIVPDDAPRRRVLVDGYEPWWPVALLVILNVALSAVVGFGSRKLGIPIDNPILVWVCLAVWAVLGVRALIRYANEPPAEVNVHPAPTRREHDGRSDS